MTNILDGAASPGRGLPGVLGTPSPVMGGGAWSPGLPPRDMCLGASLLPPDMPLSPRESCRMPLSPRESCRQPSPVRHSSAPLVAHVPTDALLSPRHPLLSPRQLPSPRQTSGPLLSPRQTSAQRVSSLRREGSLEVLPVGHLSPAPSPREPTRRLTREPRAPTLPPFFYEADEDDPIDLALLQELVALNLEVSARLNIRRIRPGEYEIESVRVSLFWQSSELHVRVRKNTKRQKRNSRSKLEVEEENSSSSGSAMLLSVYLRQLANVDTRKREADQVDAIAAAAAFAGVTGGKGLTGGHMGHGVSAALRMQSGSIAGMDTPKMPTGPQMLSHCIDPAPSPPMPRPMLPGSRPHPTMDTTAPGSIAGQAIAAFSPRATSRMSPVVQAPPSMFDTAPAAPGTGSTRLGISPMRTM